MHHVQRQSGISLIGLIFVIAILGFLGITAAKVLPTVSEFSSIKAAITKAKTSGGSVAEMQRAFDKDAMVNDVTAVRGSDLIFSKEGETTEISFSYEKKVPLFANVSLLIDYEGTTAPNGVVAEPPAEK